MPEAKGEDAEGGFVGANPEENHEAAMGTRARSLWRQAGNVGGEGCVESP